MKIAKEFDWEMGHRLPFHKGKCKNIHGHSYKMMVELEGELDENGMIMDYYDVKNIVGPVIEELDHSFMVYNGDKEVMEMIKKLGTKHLITDFQSTAENICLYILSKIKESTIPKNIKRVKVKVMETDNTYAEDEVIL